jgi:hypothetical protein
MHTQTTKLMTMRGGKDRKADTGLWGKTFCKTDLFYVRLCFRISISRSAAYTLPTEDGLLLMPAAASGSVGGIAEQSSRNLLRGSGYVTRGHQTERGVHSKGAGEAMHLNAFVTTNRQHCNT